MILLRLLRWILGPAIAAGRGMAVPIDTTVHEHLWNESDPFRQPCRGCAAVRHLTMDRFPVVGVNPWGWHVVEPTDGQVL